MKKYYRQVIAFFWVWFCSGVTMYSYQVENKILGITFTFLSSLYWFIIDKDDQENKYMIQLSKTSCSIPMPEVAAIYNPKVIARIKLCGGAVTINVDDTIAWKKPTNEQIKNLHDLFCIDVEILDGGE